MSYVPFPWYIIESEIENLPLSIEGGSGSGREKPRLLVLVLLVLERRHGNTKTRIRTFHASYTIYTIYILP